MSSRPATCASRPATFSTNSTTRSSRSARFPLVVSSSAESSAIRASAAALCASDDARDLDARDLRRRALRLLSIFVAREALDACDSSSAAALSMPKRSSACVALTVSISSPRLSRGARSCRARRVRPCDLLRGSARRERRVPAPPRRPSRRDPLRARRSEPDDPAPRRRASASAVALRSPGDAISPASRFRRLLELGDPRGVRVRVCGRRLLLARAPLAAFSSARRLASSSSAFSCACTARVRASCISFVLRALKRRRALLLGLAAEAAVLARRRDCACICSFDRGRARSARPRTRAPRSPLRGADASAFACCSLVGFAHSALRLACSASSDALLGRRKRLFALLEILLRVSVLQRRELFADRLGLLLGALGAALEVVARLLRLLLVGGERVDFRPRVGELALLLEDLIVLIRLRALARERLVADLDDLLVLLREPLFEREDLLVLLVQRLAKIEEFAARDACPAWRPAGPAKRAPSSSSFSRASRASFVRVGLR